MEQNQESFNVNVEARVDEWKAANTGESFVEYFKKKGWITTTNYLGKNKKGLRVFSKTVLPGSLEAIKILNQ